MDAKIDLSSCLGAKIHLEEILESVISIVVGVVYNWQY